MLNVPCGVSGRVRVVRENSLTGEITGDFEFENIWTNLGLAYLNSNTLKHVAWPATFSWGSGVASQPHSSVDTLANLVGNSASSSSSVLSRKVVGDVCVVQRVYTGVQAQRGVAWTLSEIGLDVYPNKVLTYAQPKNAQGVVEFVQVSPIEILTIYYTVQVIFPMELPPQQVSVSGVLGATMATFKLRPDKGGAGFGASLGMCSGTSPGLRQFAGYTTEDFGSPVHGLRGSDGKSYWTPSMMNRTTGFFGSPDNNHSHIMHIWALDPPITKVDTQELRIGVNWTFSNTQSIGISQ